VLRDFLKHPLCRATKIFPPHFFFASPHHSLPSFARQTPLTHTH